MGEEQDPLRLASQARLENILVGEEPIMDVRVLVGLDSPGLIERYTSPICPEKVKIGEYLPEHRAQVVDVETNGRILFTLTDSHETYRRTSEEWLPLALDN